MQVPHLSSSRHGFTSRSHLAFGTETRLLQPLQPRLRTGGLGLNSSPTRVPHIPVLGMWVLSAPEGLRDLGLRPPALQPRLSNSLPNNLIRHSPPPQTRRQNLRRIPLQPRQVLPQSLPNISPNQRLIPGEAQLRRNLLQVLNHILRHPNAWERPQADTSRSESGPERSNAYATFLSLTNPG